MTEPTVWVSRAMMDSTLIKPFIMDVLEADKEKAVETIRLAEKGVAVERDRYPLKMWVSYPDRWEENLPYIFTAGGFWTVSQELADVLQQFGLGSTRLYPTELFQHDRVTPIEGTYFCLAFGEQKACFEPDASPRARKIYPDKDLWKMSLAPKDDDLALTHNALLGVDLWIDPRVRNAIFLSDRLVEALKAATLTKRLGLRRCRVLLVH
ncbi:hypothetical protein [Nitratireductor sp. XY-223]|uniref:hypothetical protein n=1 Tax=Nitratireductor sp. XY-223 TaxID=2561926 RepID=UPI0010AB02F0|nr:hypothetical protein [Nitratireductor sp. XY-223]